MGAGHGRKVLFMLGICSMLTAASARADDGLFRYEPPDVDRVYPLDQEPLAPVPADPAKPAEPALPAPAATPAPSGPSVTAPVLPAPALSEPEPDFGARAAVVRPTPGTVRIEASSARDLPGAFGDPLRILDSLPGVTPIASGVPYVYIRGAPPAAQGYVYDGIPLPQLFHGAFGPAVIHPRASGPIRFYAGIPPAMYGRRAGGLILAEGTPQRHIFGAELELRLIDIGGWVETPVGDGEVTVSGRIGYPKLALLASEALGAATAGTSFNYWDGQLRFRKPIARRTTAELVWLGSFDSIKLPDVNQDDQLRAGSTKLEFHRVETRLIQRIARGEIGTALRFGFDNSELGDAVAVRAYSIGPRIWSKFDLDGGHTLRVGADLIASAGEIKNQPGGSFGSPEGYVEVSLPPIAAASARNQGGVYVQGDLQTSEHTRLEAGARFDYWSVESKIDVAVDPRLRFNVQATDDLNLHAAVGTAHQPTVFLLPLPGLTDVALSRGLTRAIQSELGAAHELPASLRVELQGYLHHYDRLLLPELVSDGVITEDPPLASALAYGTELFLKRDPNETISGWVSYTLGWATADSGPEVIGKFRPDFDVRHVINTVLKVNLPKGFVIGGRLQARSGRLIEQLNPRYSQRLPWFVRADARVGYGWKGRYANMLAYFEWLNMSLAREYLDADCFVGQCTAKSGPLLSIPNLGIRAEL